MLRTQVELGAITPEIGRGIAARASRRGKCPRSGTLGHAIDHAGRRHLDDRGGVAGRVVGADGGIRDPEAEVPPSASRTTTRCAAWSHSDSRPRPGTSRAASGSKRFASWNISVNRGRSGTSDRPAGNGRHRPLGWPRPSPASSRPAATPPCQAQPSPTAPGSPPWPASCSRPPAGAQDRAPSATQPEGRPDTEWWMKMHQSFLERAKKRTSTCSSSATRSPRAGASNAVWKRYYGPAQRRQLRDRRRPDPARPLADRERRGRRDQPEGRRPDDRHQQPRRQHARGDRRGRSSAIVTKLREKLPETKILLLGRLPPRRDAATRRQARDDAPITRPRPDQRA